MLTDLPDLSTYIITSETDRQKQMVTTITKYQVVKLKNNPNIHLPQVFIQSALQCSNVPMCISGTFLGQESNFGWKILITAPMAPIADIKYKKTNNRTMPLNRY